MNELLKFLIAELSFVYEDYGSRFIDSRCDGSSAFVTLETREGIRVRLTLDRGEVLLHFQPAQADRSDRWFSFGSLLELVTGDTLGSEVLTSELCRLVKNFFADILDALSPGKLKQSERTLGEFAKANAKRVNGWSFDAMFDTQADMPRLQGSRRRSASNDRGRTSRS